MSTCRLCTAFDNRRLFKYSTRHYCHAECGLKKWGAEFFNMIPAHMLPQLPALAVSNAGLYEQLTAKIETNRNLKGAH